MATMKNAAIDKLSDVSFRIALEQPVNKKDPVHNYGLFTVFHQIITENAVALFETKGNAWTNENAFKAALKNANASKMIKEWIIEKMNPIIGDCGVPEADG